MSPDAPSGSAPRGLRILLVEDEGVIAMLLEDILTQSGHEVVGPVARMDGAMAMAQRETLDAAILDVNLNGQEVYPVAAVLAARGIPFVFATGYDKGRLRAPYQDRPTLTKPFQWRDVSAALDKIGEAKEAAGRADAAAGKGRKSKAHGAARKRNPS
jgi:DNA-binding response OmpR family regulator